MCHLYLLSVIDMSFKAFDNSQNYLILVEAPHFYRTPSSVECTLSSTERTMSASLSSIDIQGLQLSTHLTANSVLDSEKKLRASPSGGMNYTIQLIVKMPEEVR